LEIPAGERRRGYAAAIDAKRAFLAVVWLFAVGLVPVMKDLPPEVQAITRDFVANVAFALIITWRVNDSRKR
jgi:hypothetical protein